jgi:hypothetical protein
MQPALHEVNRDRNNKKELEFPKIADDVELGTLGRNGLK